MAETAATGGEAREPKIQEPAKVEEEKVGPLTPTSAPFAGVRVLELATVIAVPSCAQYFGMLGADVIKVESPSGDTWRDFALTVMPARKEKGHWSCAFDAVNRCKKGLRLDIKADADKERLMSLMGSADIFLTNLTTPQMDKLKLGFAELRQKFPHLILARMNGWGDGGPLSNKPGYDVGCFFAATGMASLLIDNMNRLALSYPLGFGDTSVGCVLVINAANALARKMQTGDGAIVSTSLFETGLWPMQTHINGVAPKRSASYRYYVTKDNEYVAVCHDLDDQAVQKLASAVKCASGAESDIEIACAALDCKDLLAVLIKNGLTCERFHSPHEVIVNPPESLATLSQKWTHDEDCPYVPGPPVTFSKSQMPDWTQPPKLGALNERLTEDGSDCQNLWRPIDKPLCTVTTGPKGKDVKVLAGVKIVEYSVSSSAAVAGACALFAELGATVVQIPTPMSKKLEEATGEETWKQQLHGKKTRGALSDMSSATLLVTDAPESERSKFKLGAGCSTVYFDPCKGALGSFFAEACQGIHMRGWSKENSPPQAPFQLIDLLASFPLAAAMSTALFHQQRLGAEGQQTVTVNFRAVSNYMAIANLTAYQAAPALGLGYAPAEHHTTMSQVLASPVPTTQIVKLKDDKWAMTVSPDIKVDLPSLLGCLGIRWRVYPTLLFAKVPAIFCMSREKEPRNALEKLSPVFEYLNETVRDELEAMTSSEFDDWAGNAGWSKFMYPVLDATTLRTSDHCAALGLFTNVKGSVLVRAPLHITY